MSERWTDEDGVEYISCDVLCVGDYGGAGSIGEANIRSMEKEYPDAVVRHGAYYSRQLWLPVNDNTIEIIEGLESDYPLFDDEEISKVESEWEAGTWTSWLRADLLCTLPDALKEWVDGWDHGPGGDLWDVYRASMDATNTYPVFEYSGAHVRIDDIKDHFQRELMDIAIADGINVCPELAEAPMGILADCVADHGKDALAEVLRLQS